MASDNPQDNFMVISVEEIPLDFPSGSLLGQTLALWNMWAADRGAPRWRDVEMFALPPKILPMTLVVDVIDGGKDYRYRFWGTGFTESYGIDETGVFLSKAIGPAFVHASFKQLEEVRAAGRPRGFEVIMRMPKTGMITGKTNLRMPMVDDAGDVSQIMTCSVFKTTDNEERERLSRIIAAENKLWKGLS